MLWDQYKTAAKNDRMAEPGAGGWWYHHAPTVDRQRIQQHGLMPSVPNRHDVWGEIDQQPEGVYFMDSPTAAEPMMRQRSLEHQQPMDVWRVPSERLEVRPDPIVWEKSVYSPNAVTNPELFRPYEKSNDFARQFERHELPGIAGTSGPVPEDWISYHDYHELGNPSDEEWQSYGIGQPTETWKQAGAYDYYYHVAPRSERERIQAHGLHPARPTWENYPPDALDEPSQRMVNQPTGVYVTRSPIGSRTWRGHGIDDKDTWRIPRSEVQEALPDPIVRGAMYITHPVRAELFQPGGRDEDHAWYEHINYPANADRPNYYPDQERTPTFGYGWEGTRAINDNPQWGIGLPDRVIGSWREAATRAPSVLQGSGKSILKELGVPPTQDWDSRSPFLYYPKTNAMIMGQPGQHHQDLMMDYPRLKKYDAEAGEIWHRPNETPTFQAFGDWWDPSGVYQIAQQSHPGLQMLDPKEPQLWSADTRTSHGTFSSWQTVHQADLYHVSPTIERNRIKTWGLQPANPYYDNAVGPEGWEEAYGPDFIPPTGVYGFPSPEQAREWGIRPWSEPLDIWRFPGEGEPDPDTAGAYYVPHAVEPTLHEGPEHRMAGTSPKPWEAKMWHGKPISRGLMGPVRCPFWSTSAQDEAHSFAGDGGSVHPVSVRFHNPAHYFANVNWGPESFEDARQRGHDGMVVHWPGQIDDPANPQPPRTWAIALDPGAVVPGHLPGSVYESGV